MRHNPEKSEGDLSRMRAALVNSAVLADKAALVKLGSLLASAREKSAATDATSRQFLRARSKPCSAAFTKTAAMKRRAWSSNGFSSPM